MKDEQRTAEFLKDYKALVVKHGLYIESIYGCDGYVENVMILFPKSSKHKTRRQKAKRLVEIIAKMEKELSE